MSFEVKSCDSSFCSNIQFVILLLIVIFLIAFNTLRPPKWLLFSNVIWCAFIYVTFTSFTPGEYAFSFDLILFSLLLASPGLVGKPAF
jgi:hypothetical protein